MGVALGGGEQFLDAGDQRVHARARDGGAEVDRVHEGPAGLGGEGRAEEVVRHGVLDVGGEQFVVVVGEDGRCARGEARQETGLRGTDVLDRAHRYDRRPEPVGDLPQQLVLACPPSVDLVDEEERRDAQSLERAHQDAGLRLDALDRRDDQDGAVQYAEHPLHLGDEVRVARGVDEVDGHVLDRERDDGGLDGDTALPLQCERVGPGAAVVDAADLVDHTGRVQQPFGQTGLTRVYVREDSEVEQVHLVSCPSMRSAFLPGWT